MSGGFDGLSNLLDKRRLLGAAAAACLCAAAARAGVLRVDAGLATGAGNGQSWADAYRGPAALATALAAAAPGDEVWVKAGTHRPTTGTSRDASFLLEDGVALYGGFAGGETLREQRDPAANATILSGDLGVPGVAADNSYHVVDARGAGTGAVLDGFVVRDGNADGANVYRDSGGGILCVAWQGAVSSPLVRDCRFVANRAAVDGGGAYINADLASALCSPVFLDCVFEGNSAGARGGGARARVWSAARFERCVFKSNSAPRGGGIDTGSATPLLVVCSLFSGNSATSASGGGGAYVDSSFAPGDAQFVNCTFHGNSAPAGDGGGLLTAATAPVAWNCVLWANSGAGGAQTSSAQVRGLVQAQPARWSIVMGGAAGQGNLAADPRFVDASAGDFRLRLDSPGVDAGTNAALPASVLLDLGGAPRRSDEAAVPDSGNGTAPLVDIGAHELRVPLVASYCAGDLFSAGCPCGNNSAAGADEGCLNSLGVGARLGWSGSARISADTFVLLGAQLPDSTALYFQGTLATNAGLGLPFGDGLRCAGGTTTRLAVKAASGGVSQYPQAGDAPVSVRGAVLAPGSVRNYQVWYRNSAGYCTPQPFNLTNGLEVRWEL